MAMVRATEPSPEARPASTWKPMAALVMRSRALGRRSRGPTWRRLIHSHRPKPAAATASPMVTPHSGEGRPTRPFLISMGLVAQHAAVAMPNR